MAGLWSKALVECLAWEGASISPLRGPSPFNCYTGPSWSWAAYNGATVSLTSRGQAYEKVAVAKSWHAELVNKSNPYGEVKRAWLQIHGPLVRVFASVEAEEREEETPGAGLGRQRQNDALPRTSCRVYTAYSESSQRSRLWLDHPQNNIGEFWKERDPHVLILQLLRANRDAKDISSVKSLIWGLVISMGGNSSVNWSRIGWMYLNEEEGRKIMEVGSNWKTVTLV